MPPAASISHISDEGGSPCSWRLPSPEAIVLAAKSIATSLLLANASGTPAQIKTGSLMATALRMNRRESGPLNGLNGSTGGAAVVSPYAAMRLHRSSVPQPDPPRCREEINSSGKGRDDPTVRPTVTNNVTCAGAIFALLLDGGNLLESRFLPGWHDQ